MSSKTLNLANNQQTHLQDVVLWLYDAHYTRAERVVSFGEFSVNGDRIIIHPVNHVLPIAIDFFGNRIEAIGNTIPNVPKQTLESVEIQANIIDADGLQFEPGQYVVHLDHGIGQFRTLALREMGMFGEGEQITPYTPEGPSMTTRSGEMHWLPYLVLDYADGAEVAVPPDQANKLTHYIGSRRPVLSKLGSKRWQSTKKKVEEDLFKLAKDLLVVAAKRELHSRVPLPIQTEWIDQVAREFPYDETDDQQKAISDALRDLSGTKPMDRLICGDVGFGKTEVALRAAALVASAGKQVALLAPTTLLVAQHTATFQDRFKDLPIRVGHLSRFISEEERTNVLQSIREGTIDIVIGTHSLLLPSVEFKDLGLLIIDEEQKFGVKHKEQIKKARAEVDILTLSATPIPRTLFTGLSGLRDISLIMTPPKNRLPIKTTVQRSDDAVLKEAIEFEIARGGQAFVLHNDVVSIEARARQLRSLVPDTVIEVAHGQMPERALARTMAEMVKGSIQVLVTSTIIESGLDIANANTLIVEKCDHFGLSDLYQLRGRIGRSAAQAFAYFFYDTKELTHAATARFRALQESESLGSGYTIALRDLEIRGGGNVLGKEQHGNMEAIGLSLYSKLLKLTVEKIKKETH